MPRSDLEFMGLFRILATLAEVSALDMGDAMDHWNSPSLKVIAKIVQGRGIGIDIAEALNRHISVHDIKQDLKSFHISTEARELIVLWMTRQISFVAVSQ